ncbi:unnamed protein product [Moneuplotes crassus]|uniref:Uncharacterized protein n=1 Tax=Euplotes crassus TaxID=5936 RepID=A0AAD1UI30_EUPCR|nr:unnamed protein product [Moneuplotes crassus]
MIVFTIIVDTEICTIIQEISKIQLKRDIRYEITTKSIVTGVLSDPYKQSHQPREDNQQCLAIFICKTCVSFIPSGTKFIKFINHKHLTNQKSGFFPTQVNVNLQS